MVKKGKSIGINCVIKINGIVIEKVTCTKFLGVYIDDTLSWKHHAIQMSMKVSKGLGIMRQVKGFLSRNLLKTLYFSLIHPYLSYCNIIWGNASNLALNKLTILQKRALRLISHSKFRDHTSPLFKQLKILKLSDIYKFQLGQFVYNCINNLLPKSCSNHIKHYDISHQYPLRTISSIMAVPFRTKLRENYVGVSGPQFWKSLPNQITSSVSISSFKIKLKDFLIDKY